MESIPNEDDLKSSSSEEETDDHLGTGRFYECVFCKRGFTTAQALGGHMNIHRKDKAKNRPQNSSSSSSVSDKFVDDHIHNNNYASFRSFSPAVQSYPTTYNHRQYFGMAPEVHVNYQTYFPAVSTNNNNHKHLNVFGDEIWRGNLGLRVGESDHHVAAADHDKEKRQGVGEEDELDLELRLGHHDH